MDRGITSVVRSVSVSMPMSGRGRPRVTYIAVFVHAAAVAAQRLQ